MQIGEWDWRGVEDLMFHFRSDVSLQLYKDVKISKRKMESSSRLRANISSTIEMRACTACVTARMHEVSSREYPEIRIGGAWQARAYWVCILL